jgi:hypothetical protein
MFKNSIAFLIFFLLLVLKLVMTRSGHNMLSLASIINYESSEFKVAQTLLRVVVSGA